MNNKETLQQHNTRLNDNNTDLKTLLNKANNLPSKQTAEDGFIKKNLTYYYNDRLTETETYMFSSWQVGLTVVFPNVIQSIKPYAFFNCANLVKLDLAKVEKITSQYFIYGNSKFETLIIRTPKVCVLNAGNPFGSSGIANGKAYIYVPKTLIEDYKSATNWSAYADQFRAIEDYPDIVGGVE